MEEASFEGGASSSVMEVAKASFEGGGALGFVVTEAEEESSLEEWRLVVEAEMEEQRKLGAEATSDEKLGGEGGATEAAVARFGCT